VMLRPCGLGIYRGIKNEGRNSKTRITIIRNPGSTRNRMPSFFQDFLLLCFPGEELSAL
jgi:hypothetical protein